MSARPVRCPGNLASSTWRLRAMSMTSPRPEPKACCCWSFRGFLLLTLLLLVGLAVYGISSGQMGSLWAAADSAPAETDEAAPRKARNADANDRMTAPELEGGVAWLNTAGPLQMKDLRGKVVLLDFWTLCCINCIHTLPDLARLEKKYANQLVVIGVHSAKFDNEKDAEHIRKAILRYEISHPVVNDSEMKIWRAFKVNYCLTVGVMDAECNYRRD